MNIVPAGHVAHEEKPAPMLYVPAAQAAQLTAPPLEAQEPSAALRARVTVGPAKPGRQDHTYDVVSGVGDEGTISALKKDGSGGCKSAAISVADRERL